MINLARRIAGRAKWEWREFRRPTRPTFLQEELDRALLDEVAWRPGERVLDVGCGTGVYLAALGSRSVDVIGIDTDMAPLRRAQSAGRPVAAASGLRLPFADGAFETVICHKTLYLFPRPLDAARELARVIRPGGRVVFSTSNTHAPYNRIKQIAVSRNDTVNWQSGNCWSLRDWCRTFAEFGLRTVATYSCNLVWPIVFRVCDRWLIPNEWMRRYNRWVRRFTGLPLRTKRPLGAALDYVAVVQKP